MQKNEAKKTQIGYVNDKNHGNLAVSGAEISTRASEVALLLAMIRWNRGKDTVFREETKK